MTKTGAGATLLDDPDRACRDRRRGRRRGRRPGLREDAPRRSRTARARASSVGPRLVEAGAATLTLHPRSAQQMYTGTADHALTAELVELVDVPVIASGDVDVAREGAERCSRRPARRR